MGIFSYIAGLLFGLGEFLYGESYFAKLFCPMTQNFAEQFYQIAHTLDSEELYTYNLIKVLDFIN